ncbi:hypothetical protein AB0O34_01350 [Sphaerisporangium sp. NPDC088356]|uniref:hypothetical protein n=1 Tax=Sphaerisporangium sp. NPDC088356 TaxID=3154871 RepID=UPI0034366AF8
MLLDDTPDDPGLVRLDLPPGSSVLDATEALESLLADDASIEYAVLVVGDQVAGVSSRSRLVRLGSAVLRSLGDGAGATLPGESLRYRIIRFACATCGSATRRVHLDPRMTPTCPQGHGPMETRR